MHDPLEPPSFLERFDRLLRRVRRVRLAILVCLSVFAFAAGMAALAWADHRWELPLAARQALLGLLAAATLGSFALCAARVFRRWGRPRTAAELEARHPQLGQRVRTAVEFGRRTGGALAAAGAAPSLVAALEAETAARSRPLPLEAVVPRGRLAVAAACALTAAAGLIAGRSLHDEWRLAVARACLSDAPYTTIVAEPGDVRIAAGSAVELRLSLAGRADREVLLLSRPFGQADRGWAQERLVLPAERVGQSIALVKRLPRVGEAIEYRAVARRPGGRVVAETPTHRILVRYPLKIEDVRVTVTPPAYTGLPPQTFHDGQVSALAGSRGEFRITLDGHPAEAKVEIAAPAASAGEATGPQTTIEGDTVAFSLPLDRDFRWSLVARSPDGTPLPANAFRVRVREDQPPQLSFVEPDPALEVHALAEVPLRIRASDDYGLSRAGIVFQTDSAEEHVLLEEDFARLIQAAAEPSAPRTRALLERLLPLEYFALTQKDCVAYYAFAEDNFPGQPRRTESELRFIDIRPFKISYRIDEGIPGMGQDGPRILSLEEIVRRQRYALNRSIRLAKFPGRWGDGELNSIDRLMEYETDLAQATRDLAQFFEGTGTEGADVLFQAEAAMLAAVDSISVGGYDTAVVQEKDAHQRLVEARDKLIQALRQNPGLAQALRPTDRRLAQKLRRPRDENEELEQRRIVERLVGLARSQAGVGQALAERESAMAGAAARPSAESASGAGQGADDANSQRPPEEEEPIGEDAPAEEPAAEGDGSQDAAGEEPTGAGAAPTLEERQIDIVLEAQDLQRLLGETDQATELAKDRMAAAAAKADEAAGALARGDRESAARSADEAADMFGELSRQVAALLAEETTQQVAMARDIAADLTYRGRDLAEQLEGPQPAPGAPGEAPTGEEPSEEVPAGETAATDELPGPQADRLAAGGQTLLDVLRAIATRDASQSAEAVDRVAQMLDEGDVVPTVQSLAELPAAIGAPSPQVAADVRDAADRLETTARELDKLYRMLVAPRVEELKELEQRTLAMQAEMMQLATRGDVGAWERKLGGLLEELEEQGAGGGARRELAQVLEERSGASGGADARLAWALGGDGFFAAPAGVSNLVQQVAEEVQQHIQELLLTEMNAGGEEAVPPEYQQFVDRYRQVLSAQGAQP